VRRRDLAAAGSVIGGQQTERESVGHWFLLLQP
jgi:hypothetical protein